MDVSLEPGANQTKVQTTTTSKPDPTHIFFRGLRNGLPRCDATLLVTNKYIHYTLTSIFSLLLVNALRPLVFISPPTLSKLVAIYVSRGRIYPEVIELSSTSKLRSGSSYPHRQASTNTVSVIYPNRADLR